MKRIASLLLAACLLAAPHLLEKPSGRICPVRLRARGTALAGGMVAARTILPPWLGTPLGSLSSPVPK